MTRGFRFWSGDVNWLDYGGTWIRQVGPRAWHFLQLTNMDEACGRDNEGRPRYVVELSLVDLEEEGAVARGPEHDLIQAGCCFDYGARAPLHSVETNNAHEGIRECKRESRALDDQDALTERLERPVNRLGSTAAEYMAGDLTSAVVRGIEQGNDSARLVGKMYSAVKGQTLGGQMPESELAAINNALKGGPG